MLPLAVHLLGRAEKVMAGTEQLWQIVEAVQSESGASSREGGLA